MQNACPAFGFLTRNLNWTRHYVLVFYKSSEMSKKEIRVRYAEFLTLRSKLKGTVDMN